MKNIGKTFYKKTKRKAFRNQILFFIKSRDPFSFILLFAMALASIGFVVFLFSFQLSIMILFSAMAMMIVPSITSIILDILIGDSIDDIKSKMHHFVQKNMKKLKTLQNKNISENLFYEQVKYFEKVFQLLQEKNYQVDSTFLNRCVDAYVPNQFTQYSQKKDVQACYQLLDMFQDYLSRDLRQKLQNSIQEEEISQQVDKKELKKLNARLLKEQQKEIKQKEAIQDIAENLSILEECQVDLKLQYSNEILKTIFLEPKKEHFILKKKMKPFLKYFDLSTFSFDKVDIRNTDFRGTNVVIDPQKVYLKSLKNCNLSGISFSPFLSSFKNCDLSGTIIDDKKARIVLEEVTIDENTRLVTCNYQGELYQDDIKSVLREYQNHSSIKVPVKVRRKSI